MSHPAFAPRYSEASRRYRSRQHNRSIARTQGIYSTLDGFWNAALAHPGTTFQVILFVVSCAYMIWQIVRFMHMPPMGVQ